MDRLALLDHLVSLDFRVCLGQMVHLVMRAHPALLGQRAIKECKEYKVLSDSLDPADLKVMMDNAVLLVIKAITATED